MSEFDDHVKNFMDTSAAMKNVTDPTEKENLTKEFWKEAVAAFNVGCAGTVTLVDGRTLTVPTIEL